MQLEMLIKGVFETHLVTFNVNKSENGLKQTHYD